MVHDHREMNRQMSWSSVSGDKPFQQFPTDFGKAVSAAI